MDKWGEDWAWLYYEDWTTHCYCPCGAWLSYGATDEIGGIEVRCSSVIGACRMGRGKREQTHG